MATILKLGPADHSRSISLEEFNSADTELGYRYEIIRGRVYVSPEANFPHVDVEMWLLEKIIDYRRTHSDIINFTTNKARVFVPGEPEVTAPEPDMAAYHDFPTTNREAVRWQDVSPILVAEVISPDDPDKDFVRNVDLYLQVSSIREYWILDGREGHAQLRLHVYRRHGRRWRHSEVGPGERYSTRLLPGFELVVDPST